MATANLSVGINTKPAKQALTALRAELEKTKVSIPITLDPKTRVKIDTSGLALQIKTAIQDGFSGAKVSAGSLDTTQILAALKKIDAVITTGLADAGQEGAKRLTRAITDDFGNLVNVSYRAGKASGKALANGLEEEAKKAKISYRFKEGVGAVGASLPTNYTAEQVKARAEAEKADASAKASMLKRIDMMRTEFEAKKQLQALNEAGYRQQELAKQKAEARLQALNEVGHRQMQYRQIQQAQSLQALNEAGYRQQELAKQKAEARLQALNEVGHRQMQYRQIQQAQSLQALNEAGYRQQELAKQAHYKRMELLDARFAASSAKSQLSKAKLAESLSARGVDASGVVGPLAASFGNAAGIAQLSSATKQLGEAHKEATGHTKTHAAAMRDAHSAARGLASGMGMMWLTWGNIAPLLAGASLSHGFIQAMKAGTEFAYQLTFVKALGGETAESVRGIGNAALEMSKSGLYGPVELANGLRTLNQAGIKTKDAMMALPHVFDLATVGEMSMADAAITLAGVMTAFNLQVKDMSHIGDVFAKAAAESQTSVEQMTQAMKTASVVGDQYGASMEDTATALTLLAKLNITGTAAGTSLRNMLKELYSPTEKAASIMKNLGVSAQTASGELKPFPDVIFSLKGKLEQFNKVSQVKILQGLFGERGAKEAVAMLSQARDEWDKLNKTISESGGFMAKVSAELEATTKGSFKKAVNTLQATLIEAFQSSEGAAGQLAIKLQQTFNSESFRAAVNGIVTGMLGLTNALVAMGPVLAAVAAGWVAVRGAMVLASVWTSVSTAVMTTSASLLAVSGAMGPTVTGLVGLRGALAALMGPVGWFITAVTTATTVLGYLYLKMRDDAPSRVAAQNANIAATAMQNLANKISAATKEYQRLEREKQGKTELGPQKADIERRIGTYEGDVARLEELRKTKRAGKLSFSELAQLGALEDNVKAQREALKNEIDAYVSAQRDYKEGLRAKTSGSVLGAEQDITDLPTSGLKPSQVAAKKVAQGTADWLKQNTKFIIENYGEQAAYILDRVTKNLNEQVQDAKIATGTKNYEVGGGGGGRADRAAAKLENANVKSLEDRYRDELQKTDAHYARLEKIESTSAQYGIKTREEAEAKISDLTAKHWNERLEKVSSMSAEMSALLGKSVNLSAADAEKAESFVKTAKAEIEVLQEKISWIKEEAKLKAQGEAVQRRKEIGKADIDLEKIRQQYQQKMLGDGLSATDRVRNEGSLAAKDKYDQLLQNALTKVNTARTGTDLDAIMEAEAQYDDLMAKALAAQQMTGDYFVKVYEQSQTAAEGWKKFWNQYEENGTTAAKVVEQSLESVTKNIEDAFADMFKTGKFDAKKMVDSILSDVGRLVAKLAVSDLGNLLFGKGKPSGDVIGNILGMSGKKEGEGNQPEGLSGLLTKAAEGLKGFWNSLTGATSATIESTAKTVENVLTMGTKKVAETSSTAALTELAAAAQMAATSLSTIGSTGGGGGGGELGGLLGAAGKGGGTSAASASATADFVPYTWAKGGAFRNGIQAFAKGGTFSNSIVRQPTLFRFADGIGMMGEAGPEVIMPLARDSQGRLGVRYEGREAPQRQSDMKVTNNNISVSVNAPGGDPAQVRRSGAAVAREVAGAIAMSGRYR